MTCLGVSLYEATLHGDESLVLPAVDRWQARTGFYPSILPLWSPFDRDLPAPQGGLFPAGWLMEDLRARGIEPAIYAHSAGKHMWATHGYEAILAGERDEALELWGLAAADYGHRLIFRWDHEMNGKFPWSLRDPGEYKAVFRYVSHRIRDVAGAQNVLFYFCPSMRRGDAGLDLIESYYPGDEWSQQVGFDAYSRLDEWRPMADDWQPIIKRLRQMTKDPILVGEFGRRIDLRGRAGWLDSLRDVRNVTAVMYFDMNLKRFKPPAHRWRMNWRMRAVYRELPRCPARVLAPVTPIEPSPSPEIEPGSSPEATSEPAS